MNDQENKYYTPELEEFHVGFEFEMAPFLGETGRWLKLKIKSGTLFPESTEGLRVKYLDNQDIEELGWEAPEKQMYDFCNNYILNDFGIVHNVGPLTDKKLNVYTSHDDLIFSGIIKNKSELKKLMKQLGIQ